MEDKKEGPPTFLPHGNPPHQLNGPFPINQTPHHTTPHTNPNLEAIFNGSGSQGLQVNLDGLGHLRQALLPIPHVVAGFEVLCQPGLSFTRTGGESKTGLFDRGKSTRQSTCCVTWVRTSCDSDTEVGSTGLPWVHNYTHTRGEVRKPNGPSATPYLVKEKHKRIRAGDLLRGGKSR